MGPPLSLYIHIPFCEVKCGYCDFFSVPRGHEDFDLQGRYTTELSREIGARGEALASRQIGSIYFGGGTPSLLEPRWIEKILTTLSRTWGWDSRTEMTLEANPKTVSRERLAAFRALGINRVSVGVQSFQDHLLKKMGRIHSGREALQTLEDATAVGFKQINLDLIYALPGQRLKDLEGDLATAISLGLPHLSAYSLIVEAGTPFETLAIKGELPVPDEEVAREMFELVQDYGTNTGLFPYEVSNFSHRGFECRHNLNYWNYGEYLGFGAGAVSFLREREKAAGGPLSCGSSEPAVASPPAGSAPPALSAAAASEAFVAAACESFRRSSSSNPPAAFSVPNYGYRRQNVRSLQQYLAGHWEDSTEPIPLRTAMGEWWMLGLRQREGVLRGDFRRRFGQDLDEVFDPLYPSLRRDGWLCEQDDRIRLSQKALPLADEIMQRFLE